MRLNIVRDQVKRLTGQRTASKWITSPQWVNTWARDMVMRYWSVAILFWQLSIDHIVSVIYKRWGLAKTRLRHPSLPFDSLPYPTRTICRRVRTSVSHVTTKRKEVDLIPWVWGSVPRALRAGGSPAIIIIVAYYYHFISNEGGLNILFLFCLQYLLFLPKRQLQLQHSHQVEEEQGIALFAKDPWEGTTF